MYTNIYVDFSKCFKSNSKIKNVCGVGSPTDSYLAWN